MARTLRPDGRSEVHLTRRRGAARALPLVVLFAWTLAGCGAKAPRPDEVSQLALTSPDVVALIDHTSPVGNYIGSYRCAGVLVGRREVLTATHCVHGSQPGGIDVVVNAQNLCAAQDASVEERIRVRSWTPVDGRHSDLLELELTAAVETVTPVRIGSGPRPIWAAVGWGHRDGPTPCDRVVSALKPAPADACVAARRQVLREAARIDLCAVPRFGRNTCLGDSGGPMFAESADPTRLTLVAITSSGIGGCGPGDVGLYAQPPMR